MLSVTLTIQRLYMADLGYYRELHVTQELVRYHIHFYRLYL